MDGREAGVDLVLIQTFLLLYAPWSIAFSQEHFKTISCAKFGGQTECVMGNWKIVNGKKLRTYSPTDAVVQPLGVKGKKSIER